MAIHASERGANTGRRRPNQRVEEQPEKTPGGFKRKFKRVVAVFLVLLLAVGGWIGYDLARISGSLNPLSALPSSLSETNGRTNIILAGYSNDDPGHGGADLTDSIMLLSIDTKNKKADLISIPRDLYINIPGSGYAKINEAYQKGETSKFEEDGYIGGGLGLLQKTVEQATGVKANYATLINYTAFRDTVNAVGGITINLQTGNPNGLYDTNANRLRLPNGQVELNGQQALDLARARGSGYGSYGLPGGDYDRAKHQQQMLVALKEKAASPGVIANPFKVGSLARAAGDNVRTTLSIGEIQTLYLKAKDIPSSDIKSYNLKELNGQQTLKSYNARGQSAVIPTAGMDDYSDIKAAISRLIAPAE